MYLNKHDLFSVLNETIWDSFHLKLNNIPNLKNTQIIDKYHVNTKSFAESEIEGSKLTVRGDFS